MCKKIEIGYCKDCAYVDDSEEFLGSCKLNRNISCSNIFGCTNWKKQEEEILYEWITKNIEDDGILYTDCEVCAEKKAEEIFGNDKRVAWYKKTGRSFNSKGELIS